MTRYSRSVLPGRHPDEEPQDNPGLDRMVFGGRSGSRPAAANDRAEPDFLPPVMDEEADLLTARANADRRKSNERRLAVAADRRSPQPGRRAAEYKPLRNGGRVQSDESKRGPILLIGALMIVAVFGFVVWNAYRDGLQTDEVEVAPELSTAGSFKTPPRTVEPAPVAAEPETAVLEPLEGPPLPVEPNDEVRPTQPAAATTAARPAPSKYMAPPPPVLKPPASAHAAAAPPAQQPAPKPVAAAPKPVVVAPVPAVASAPAPGVPSFAPGNHVVQIAATTSEAAANGEWTKLLKANPELLTGGEKFIQQADVNGKTVYRLRVGSFASKADAAAFCSAFKAKGGNCYPAVK